MSSEPTPTSVYVHFPWCARKCPYCDFATEPVTADTIAHDAYADALARELEYRAADLHGRTLFSVFFGGGTPSLWRADALERTLKRIRSAFASEADELEVTAECNPSSLSQAHAAALRDAGVTRVSLGVQSLRDEHLRFLGRLHDSATALIALEAAVREVPRVSADLMFGMPKQTPEALSEDVSRLVDAGVEHVSAYALTIEPRTLFGSLHKTGRLEVATEDRYADLFETAHAKFAAFGFDHYEVSNYARDGKVSQHNLHYWHGGAYVGLGSSAVGCLDHGVGRALRWRNEPIPQRYMAEPCKEGEAETLGPTELVREALMLGLRTSEGVDVGATERRAGQAIELGRERDVARALDRGDLVAHEGRLRVPQDRWLKLDGIVRDLF